MKQEYYLMLENTPILYFHTEDIEVKVLNKDLLPFSLREKIKNPSNEDLKEYYKESAKNLNNIKEFCSSRLLSLSRENAKQIYAACNLIQDNSIENRFQICLSCKGVNLQDAYWIRTIDSNDTWESVNPKMHHLAEIVDIALGGESPTFTANPICPELTTKGLFRKAWIRENDELYLLKSDKTPSFINTKMEILSSKILDCTNVPHTQYEKAQYNNIYTAKCKNFVTDHKSFVEAQEIYDYCKDTEQDYTNFVLKRFAKDFANISVIDFVLQNTDRHLQNYGFFMDNSTGELVDVAPLFDHNQALIADIMEKDVVDTMSQMLHTKETIKEIYEKFSPYADIEFDCSKWQKLKEEMQEYKKVLKKVEERIINVRCIKKIIIPRHELEFPEMAKDLEKQCKMQNPNPDSGTERDLGMSR